MFIEFWLLLYDLCGPFGSCSYGLGSWLLHGLFVAAAGLHPSAPLVSAMMFLAFCGVPVASVGSPAGVRTMSTSDSPTTRASGSMPRAYH